MEGTTITLTKWTKILPRLEAGTYEPTPEVEAPAIHAPIPENNLPYRPGMHVNPHPQPVVRPCANLPYPKSWLDTEGVPETLYRASLNPPPWKTSPPGRETTARDSRHGKQANSRSTEAMPCSGPREPTSDPEQ